jgi:hypothetical protein
MAPNSRAGTWLNAPCSRPMGVRTALKITAFSQLCVIMTIKALDELDGDSFVSSQGDAAHCEQTYS